MLITFDGFLETFLDSLELIFCFMEGMTIYCPVSPSYIDISEA